MGLAALVEAHLVLLLLLLPLEPLPLMEVVESKMAGKSVETGLRDPVARSMDTVGIQQHTAGPDARVARAVPVEVLLHLLPQLLLGQSPLMEAADPNMVTLSAETGLRDHAAQ